jgi:hypothetical protein
MEKFWIEHEVIVEFGSQNKAFPVPRGSTYSEIIMQSSTRRLMRIIYDKMKERKEKADPRIGQQTLEPS